jgi:hypothetical protein
MVIVPADRGKGWSAIARSNLPSDEREAILKEHEKNLKRKTATPAATNATTLKSTTPSDFIPQRSLSLGVEGELSSACIRLKGGKQIGLV